MAVKDPLDMVIGTDDSQHRDPEAATRHFTAGRQAEAVGERERAIVEFRRAVTADPGNNALLFALAYRLDLVGEEEQAIALYEQICDRGPAPINALMNLAVLYEDRGDYGRAERCLRQVLESDPNHPRGRLFMKDVLASREMHVEDEHDRDFSKRKALLETPVTDFELSVRARTALKKMNIRTLGDLLRITEPELMSYKNFGDSTLQEIKQMLAAKNLRLGQGVDDSHRSARRQVAEEYKGTGKEGALSRPVSELRLSVRARKALQLLNIQSLGDLASHTEAELMGVKNFGATSLQEVKERLAENGLGLRVLEK